MTPDTRSAPIPIPRCKLPEPLRGPGATLHRVGCGGHDPIRWATQEQDWRIVALGAAVTGAPPGVGPKLPIVSCSCSENGCELKSFPNFEIDEAWPCLSHDLDHDIRVKQRQPAGCPSCGRQDGPQTPWPDSLDCRRWPCRSGSQHARPSSGSKCRRSIASARLATQLMVLPMPRQDPTRPTTGRWDCSRSCS